MKKNFLTIFILASALLLLTISSADAHTRKNTLFIQGTMGFSSSSGDLHGNESQTTINVSPTVQYFFFPQLALGGRLNWQSMSQGDFNSSSISIGPAASYYFMRHGKAIPYLGAGVFLQSNSSEYPNPVGTGTISTDQSGSTFSLYGGVALFLKEHLALTPELSINMESLEDVSGTTIMLSVGLAGFLYDPKGEDDEYLVPDTRHN